MILFSYQPSLRGDEHFAWGPRSRGQVSLHLESVAPCSSQCRYGSDPWELVGPWPPSGPSPAANTCVHSLIPMWVSCVLICAAFPPRDCLGSGSKGVCCVLLFGVGAFFSMQ